MRLTRTPCCLGYSWHRHCLAGAEMIQRIFAFSSPSHREDQRGPAFHFTLFVVPVRRVPILEDPASEVPRLI